MFKEVEKEMKIDNLTNLLDETLAVLKSKNKTPEDIVFIGNLKSKQCYYRHNHNPSGYAYDSACFRHISLRCHNVGQIKYAR